MIASLPMYVSPASRAAHDRFWQAIRDHLTDQGIAAPANLTSPDDIWAHWTAPDLMLSQTCGMPFRTKLQGNVALVGTPDYDLADAPAGHYYSVLIMRRGGETVNASDWPTLRFVANEALSQSGFAAPLNHMESLGLDLNLIGFSGGHRISAQMVAQGDADIASLDAQTWRLITRETALGDHLSVVGKTAPTPGLPYITNKTGPVRALRVAIDTAIAQMSPADQDILNIKSLTRIPEDAYLAIPTPAPRQFD